MAPRQTAALKKVEADSAVQNGTGDAIDIGVLDDWVGFHLRMAQIASFQSFARHAQGIELSPGRFAALVLIDRNPGISQTALSRANGRDKSTLTPLLVDLVRRGLVRRTQIRNDRRSYGLTLTKAGEQLLEQLTACAREHERKLDAVIGARARAQFLKTLRKLAAELE